MSAAIVCIAAFLASTLTFFSGFGLGTLLMPVFAVWFPIEIAIALTAVVHLLNNLFKLLLVGRHVDRAVVVRFGLPALAASAAGAWALSRVSGWQPLASYEAFGRVHDVVPVKVVIATLIVAFTLFEALPGLRRWSLDARWLPAGGIVSGFFGGLSGHQGALRSMFLSRSGLSKQAFVGTGVAIACLVDVTRLAVYGQRFELQALSAHASALVPATLAAFAGAFLGSKLLEKITMTAIQAVLSVCLVLMAIALGIGVI